MGGLLSSAMGYCAAFSSEYLDILKDRLYCEAADAPRRRSAQRTLLRIVDDLTRLMAPILPFTAQEIWEFLPGPREESVHFALFPGKGTWDEALLARWRSHLLAVREEVLKRRIGWMKCQWDISLEAAGLILQVAQADQMVGAIFLVFDVAIQHGCIGFQANVVGGAGSFQPLFAINFVVANHAPDALVENLGSASGQ